MRTRRFLALLLAGLTPAGAVGVTRASAAADAVYPATRIAATQPRPPATAPGPRPTVAVLLGPAGANAADVLGPYETLAASGRYHVVTVAPTRDPVTLTGGLDVVPDHTFADLPRPEWIVVPEVQEAGSPRLQPAVDWLRQRYAAGAGILSVCAGAGLLARTGLLTGRPATSSWLGLYGFERQFPDVSWRRGTRYVDDGRIISTAAVLSGIDGALRILEREHGPDAARQAAAAVRYPAYHPGGPAPIDAAGPRPADSVALLNAAFRNPARAEVLLTPGVGEIQLASVFRTYTQLSYAAQLTAATADGRPIRSRHGLTFVPRAVLGGGYDRLLVPGRAVPVDPQLKPVFLHTSDEFPFESTLRDLAATTDLPTARWVAKTLEYRPGPLSGPALPWAPALWLLLTLLSGAILYAAMRAFLSSRPRVRNWLRHLIEMLVAMVAGMLLTGPLGHGRPIVMALGMAAGMALWMAVRGHGVRMISEMAAVMVLPFLFVEASAVGHVVMLAGMVLVMVLRFGHYSGAPGWVFRGRPVVSV